jgi:outer membrane protein TolC
MVFLRRTRVSFLLFAGSATCAAEASAGPFDLDDEKPTVVQTNSPTTFVGPPTSAKARVYNLEECLALADRNHPNLWAARARLAGAHAQLDEAKYSPYSYWSANSQFGLAPAAVGNPFYNALPRSLLERPFEASLLPFFRFSVQGQLPIYTFGKIGAIKRAAEAQVRVNEWDIEKARYQVRADVRRAYFGLMAARDALYIADDVFNKLNTAIEGVSKKLDSADTSVEEGDRLRLEIFRDELLARTTEAKKGATYASAALRFLTGIETDFDIPDEPIKRPDEALGPVVRYLTAARMFRPDVNMARAGVAARRAMVDFARAQLFPNIGVGAAVSYSVAPGSSADQGYNSLGAQAAFGIDWPLDLLPRNARLHNAEAQLEELRATERLALGGVAVEVELAHATALEAKTREENWDRAEHRAKRWLSIVQDSVDLGTATDRALIEPFRTFVSARENHVRALMDLHVGLSELARVTGRETTTRK